MGNSCSLSLRYVFLVSVPKCNFVFPPLGFLSGNFFLIVPFPDHCLDFDIVHFPFLDGDVPRRGSYGVYISQNLLGLLETAIMLRTSTLEIHV